MKKILAILILIFTQNLFAQNTEGYGFAIIDDKDGFTNVREEPNLKSKIVGKIKEGELFFCRGNENFKDWFEIIYQGRKDLSGYILRSQVRFIRNLSAIKNRKSIGDTLYIKNDSINLSMTIGKFNETQHKFLKDENSIIKIDAKRPLGTDGELPKTEIKSINVMIREKLIRLPKKEINDLFEINLSSCKVYLDMNNNVFFTFDVGYRTGLCLVAYSFKNKRFVNRCVFYSF
jgi:flavodoxin